MSPPIAPAGYRMRFQHYSMTKGIITNSICVMDREHTIYGETDLNDKYFIRFVITHVLHNPLLPSRPFLFPPSQAVATNRHFTHYNTRQLPDSNPHSYFPHSSPVPRDSPLRWLRLQSFSESHQSTLPARRGRAATVFRCTCGMIQSSPPEPYDGES